MPQKPTYAETLIALARQKGAVDAVYFTPSMLVFDPRTLLKCMFGCTDWGKGPTCPSRPGSPSLAEYKDMLLRYKWGILVHAHDKHASQRASYAMEQKAFNDGYYFAFSFSDCGLCKECAGTCGEACRNVRIARPALHSVGIDIFQTVKQFDLPLYTLTEKDEVQNWYSAVFVE